MNGLFDRRVVTLISLSSIALSDTRRKKTYTVFLILPSAEGRHQPSFKKDSKSRVSIAIAIGIKLK